MNKSQQSKLDVFQALCREHGTLLADEIMAIINKSWKEVNEIGGLPQHVKDALYDAGHDAEEINETLHVYL